MPITERWWLYVLECQGGVLYTGIAKDVDARFAAVRARLVYTHNPVDFSHT